MVDHTVECLTTLLVAELTTATSVQAAELPPPPSSWRGSWYPPLSRPLVPCPALLRHTASGFLTHVALQTPIPPPRFPRTGCNVRSSLLVCPSEFLQMHVQASTYFVLFTAFSGQLKSVEVILYVSRAAVTVPHSH